LNYELDTYLDALQHFPEHVDVLQTTKGNAQLIKKDIFKNMMWYTLPDSNKHYPLSIETVKKIKAQNEKGIRPEELETAEVTNGGKPKEIEPQFVDVVGQISLRTLDRNAQKKKQREGQRNRGNEGNRPGPTSQRQIGAESNRPAGRPKVATTVQKAKSIESEAPIEKKNITISSSPKAPEEPRKIIRPIKENKGDQPTEE
jgi:hypothetical protein